MLLKTKVRTDSEVLEGMWDKREAAGELEMLIHWNSQFHSHSQSQSQHSLGLLHGWQGSRYWSHHCCLSAYTFGGSWIGSKTRLKPRHSNMGWVYPKWHLNHHSKYLTEKVFQDFCHFYFRRLFASTSSYNAVHVSILPHVYKNILPYDFLVLGFVYTPMELWSSYFIFVVSYGRR